MYTAVIPAPDSPPIPQTCVGRTLVQAASRANPGTGTFPFLNFYEVLMRFDLRVFGLAERAGAGMILHSLSSRKAKKNKRFIGLSESVARLAQW